MVSLIPHIINVRTPGGCWWKHSWKRKTLQGIIKVISGDVVVVVNTTHTTLHYTLKTQTVENVKPHPFKKEIKNRDSYSNVILLSYDASTQQNTVWIRFSVLNFFLEWMRFYIFNSLGFECVVQNTHSALSATIIIIIGSLDGFLAITEENHLGLLLLLLLLLIYRHHFLFYYTFHILRGRTSWNPFVNIDLQKKVMTLYYKRNLYD